MCSPHQQLFYHFGSHVHQLTCFPEGKLEYCTKTEKDAEPKTASIYPPFRWLTASDTTQDVAIPTSGLCTQSSHTNCLVLLPGEGASLTSVRILPSLGIHTQTSGNTKKQNTKVLWSGRPKCLIHILRLVVSK